MLLILKKDMVMKQNSIYNQITTEWILFVQDQTSSLSDDKTTTSESEVVHLDEVKDKISLSRIPSMDFILMFHKSTILTLMPILEL